jgi:hypothetical protein
MPEKAIMYVGTEDRLLKLRGGSMPRTVRLKRKSFFMDERKLRQARKALGARSDAEAVRAAVERVTEMERFWRFMARSHGKLLPGSFEAP